MGAPRETPMVPAGGRTTSSPRPGLTQEQHGALVDLYHARLAHLLQMQVTDRPDLSRAEQVRLRSRGLLHAVRMLTWLGEGEVASKILRERRQD